MIPVIFSVMAERDLESIADYVADDSPIRALNFVQELRKQCLNLGLFPHSYRIFPELGENLRIMPYRNYLVLYHSLGDIISIERILHAARDNLKSPNNDETI